MTQYTPGPWELSLSDSCYLNNGHSIKADGLDIAHVEPWDEDDSMRNESIANACLISTAPDLLAALDAIFNGSGMTGDNMDLARAAIAKARGLK